MHAFRDILITRDDCGTRRSVDRAAFFGEESTPTGLAQAIRGRVARENILHPVTGDVLVCENGLIADQTARNIEDLRIPSVTIRSPLTCEARNGLCRRCYGAHPSDGELAAVGLPAGVHAALALGGPAKLLEERSLSIFGGTPRGPDPRLRAGHEGRAHYQGLRVAGSSTGQDIALSWRAELLVLDEHGHELERHAVPPGSVVAVRDGQPVTPNQTLAIFDSDYVLLVAQCAGVVRLAELVEGATMKLEAYGPIQRRHVIGPCSDLRPRVEVVDDQGHPVDACELPRTAILGVEAGEPVQAGQVLARIPKTIKPWRDWYGGLRSLIRILEARKPDDAAVLSQIGGRVVSSGNRPDRKIRVVDDRTAVSREHPVPRWRHIRVHAGDLVEAGEPLVDGEIDVQDLLRFAGRPGRSNGRVD